MALDLAPAPAADGWHLDHSYARLPDLFFARVAPTPVRAPRLVLFNAPLAKALGLSADALSGETGAAIFSGNRLPPGAAPLAQAYAGHQYGNFTTLGDGRAILLSEQLTPQGERVDVQLKGSGPTPYSRRGDGRAALGPMLREYVISEAMQALGIPTTRSLAVVATGEEVWRETALPGAVLTRIAASHLRVGTFEWALVRGGEAAVRALVEYTLQRHYPDQATAANPAQALLEAVMERQARLLAQWMLVGFVHGVMNTDNMAISGETIDYGPCAFLEAYDVNTVFSSIDRHGRYAYGNQPPIAQWNLARFAECLLPLLHPEKEPAIALATELIERFADRFQTHWLAGARRKLGLANEEADDLALVEDLLGMMQRTRADFTNTFAALVPTTVDPATLPDPGFAAWLERWRARLARQPASEAEAAALRAQSNPAFIPRNHLVEAALTAAQQEDLQPLQRLLDIVSSPFAHTREAPEYRSPAPTDAAPYRTFCGT